MALKDLMKNIGGMFSKVTADITRRPDGGTSHYRPLRKKTQGAPMQDMTMQGPAMQQDTPFVHTGFTGMNPPANYGGFDQQTAYGQTAYGQTAYGQTAYGQPAYGQPANSQPAYGETGYARNDWSRPQENQATYFRNSPQDDRQDYVGKGSFTGGFTAAKRNNISYMPGMEPRGERRDVHVEHIITLTGLKSCYEAIEFMKDGETLIVMLDAIANESESMRCQDMLAGAAFTLGCSVRLLNGSRIVIIAPEGVKILPEQPAGFEPVRMPEMAAARAVPAAEAPRQVRRERRSPTAEFEAARSGQLKDYNPYTGTMPVAAGSYASFGGYGY